MLIDANHNLIIRRDEQFLTQKDLKDVIILTHANCKDKKLVIEHR